MFHLQLKSIAANMSTGSTEYSLSTLTDLHHDKASKCNSSDIVVQQHKPEQLEAALYGTKGLSVRSANSCFEPHLL